MVRPGIYIPPTRSTFPQEACIWVPGSRPVQMLQVLAALQLYMTPHNEGGTRPSGWPEIAGYRVLDDRGGTGCFQIRVEGLKASQVQKLLPHKDIDVTMEDQ